MKTSMSAETLPDKVLAAPAEVMGLVTRARVPPGRVARERRPSGMTSGQQ